MRLRRIFLVAALLWVGFSDAHAQSSTEWASVVEGTYRVVPNITYQVASNWEAKLDVYQATSSAPAPVVLYIHGGGWTGGSKEGSVLRAMPYLEMGFSVVNVEYRLARVALAPAAVEDCLCALRWVIRNAKQYNFDTTRIVVTGHSAGGHLALTTGMIPASAGLDRQCPGSEELKVAAVVNWYGITDVVDLLDGPNMKTYAVTWLSSLTNREEIARRVSPLTYVRKDLPPIITVHGDADPTVPYAHATRLNEALKQAGATHQLVTIPGGRHGGFPRDQMQRAYSEIRAFLRTHNVLKSSSN